ncbi:Solute carrier family 2, facilitated glucose transporter member 1 [Hypsibius exemplaris]|uniref:Solute carrier family 2, facilitated glucose transporter member 1 n=1 Tax=Hypsibius exemplaris TaxID=2072580 RepID=A0A1W0WKU7_HYPEX|nr:Solute carrier family 2, facilitated glucose transporter member 1 [Hypsibius exemplaris]
MARSGNLAAELAAGETLDSDNETAADEQYPMSTRRVYEPRSTSAPTAREIIAASATPSGGVAIPHRHETSQEKPLLSDRHMGASDEVRENMPAKKSDEISDMSFTAMDHQGPLNSKPPRRQRPTVTLLFAVFTATLGTWFATGYYNVALNVPQEFVVRWIRQVECQRHYADGRGNYTESYNESEAVIYTAVYNYTDGYRIWCARPTGEPNFKLNTIWAVISSMARAGILLCCFSCPYLIKRFGLKGSIYLSSATFLLGTVLSALVSLVAAYELLIIGRLLCGIAEGLTCVAAVIYISEITPVNLRGAFGTTPMIMMVIGSLTANTLGLPMMFGNAAAWPTLLALQSIPVVITCICLPFCADSPRAVLQSREKCGTGMLVRARKALVWFRRTDDVDDELDVIVSEQAAKAKGATAKQVSLLGILKDPYLRSIFWLCGVPMFAKQFSGYVCIQYYSTSIFKGVGLSQLHSSYATLGMWLTFLCFSLISMGLVDRLGRRAMLLTSYTGMITGMSLFTVFLIVSGPYEVAWAKYGCAASIYLFMASYSTGSSSVPWYLPTELYPQEARTAAVTWMNLFSASFGMISALAFPMVVIWLKEYTFLVFVTAIATSAVFVAWKLPETKGRTFEAIQLVLQSRFKRTGHS